MKAIKVPVMLMLAVLLMPASAVAADYFGALTVTVDGVKRSESTGGYVFKTAAGSVTTRITFRDVAPDGWGTKAEAPTQGLEDNAYWVALGKPQTKWYGTADGWQHAVDLNYSSISHYWYRTQPSICWHTPWWKPDVCARKGWQYAPLRG